MWHLNNEKERLLERLCSCCSPSARESSVQKMISSEFADMGIKSDGDAMGNLYASINPDSPMQVAVVAHADEIGIQIEDIDDHGLLRMRKIGGLRSTSLHGHRVRILSDNGDLCGIVGSDPLQDNGTENGILVNTRDLWVDIGAENRRRAEQLVKIGNFGVFEPDTVFLGDNRIASKSLDDRLGIFVMIEAMRELRMMDLGIGVTAISSVQEELSMRGISSCCRQFKAAVILDVDFATDIPTDKGNMGNLSLGRGVGININADNNPVMQRLFIKVSGRENIPYQPTLSRALTGGTDATKIQVSGDVATLNVNLPLRYMNSHYELCDKRDIGFAVNAVAALIKEINDSNLTNFVPWQN